MGSKMPKLAKVVLMAVCASALLNLTCELVWHGGFIASFLGYAAGLDHKAVVLVAPIVKIVTAVTDYGLFMLVLAIALALGKSWARKTYIVLVALQVVGVGLDAAASSMSPCFASGQEDASHWWDWVCLAMDMSAATLLFVRDVRAWYREDASVENKWKNRLQCLVFWTLSLIVGVELAIMQGVASGIANPRKMASKYPRVRVAELMARADHGDALSMWRLGNWEKNGWLGEKHPDKAFDWYKKAADLGDKFAFVNLGECYEKGWGTETNATLAAKWFLKGAERHHVWGMEKTGDFYRDGYGVEKDVGKAREWYEKAVKRGSRSAKKKLDALPDEQQEDADKEKARAKSET